MVRLSIHVYICISSCDNLLLAIKGMCVQPLYILCFLDLLEDHNNCISMAVVYVDLERFIE